ncbi:MAG: hypothetical protein TREMPRED_003811 [Tremellales sp. Tagirdzhanova-0007]|nr:MAG: hypothetical protein TREMPRED_003811 [Tremellales sp. Tagirdzhanova-0007]
MADRWMITAFILSIASNVAYAILDLFIQKLQNFEHLPAAQLIYIRMGGSLFFSLPWLYYTRTPHAPFGPPEIRHLLWIRAVSSVLSCSCGVLIFAYLTLSEGITIFSLRPFPIAILCYIFLSEPFSKTQIWGCVISMLGVVLIAYPQLLGVHVPLVDDGLEGSLSSRILGVVFGIGYMLVSRTPFVIPSTPSGWMYLIAVVIVFAVLAQWIMYGNWPTYPAVLGMVVITLTGLATIRGPQEEKEIGIDEEAAIPLIDDVEP